MLALPLLIAAPSWVLFSPVTRQLDYKAYENGYGVPWAGPDSFDLAKVAIRWDLPQSSDTDDQLASGISFAIHQDFCKRLLPLFPEQSEMDNSFFGTAFLSCNELRDAIKRGFDTWAINHKKIYFRDVSDQCADVTSYDYCPAAELWIVPDNEFATERDLAAYVTHQQSNFDRQPYSTAGELIANGIGCRNARMAVRAPTAADTNDDFCWYLDSTFCYTFHRWKDADVDVIMIARIVCVVLFILALAVVLWVIFQAFYAVLFQAPDEELGAPPGLAKNSSAYQAQRGTVFQPQLAPSKTTINLLNQVNAHHKKYTPGEGSELVCKSQRLTNLVKYVAVAPTGLLGFAIFWMIFAPVFYFRIFIPCTSCYDFEATIAHEVGHVLGFHHPDREWEMNLNANGTMNAGTCMNAFSHVHLNQTQDIRDSIMFSLTTHRDRTCLSVDDLEGLNYLYPVCDGAYGPIPETGEPLCIKSVRLSGWLRLLYAVLFPTFIVNFIIFVLQTIVRRHQERRMVSLEATAARLRTQRAQLMLRMKDKAETKIKENVGRARSVMGGRNVSTTNPRRRSGQPGTEMTQSVPEDGPTDYGTSIPTPASEDEARHRAAQLRELEDIELQQAIQASRQDAGVPILDGRHPSGLRSESPVESPQAGEV